MPANAKNRKALVRRARLTAVATSAALALTVVPGLAATASAAPASEDTVSTQGIVLWGAEKGAERGIIIW
ncbi:hypothetical protein DNL40_12945 [Xylanimonas oleitrophica]|uniref:Uncharacterized protein n=1 Tax=Xylanimonas oleitrophica TaxID=2607479 RepID=A0A2W5WM98_9MICO|nr:hypothetical protein [Xylanimonas oleitrophica]PZR52122.1 hypothetical protein DNL40_12945 [Xylanimonas oleitrophica]